jgi:hypothetical protein
MKTSSRLMLAAGVAVALASQAQAQLKPPARALAPASAPAAAPAPAPAESGPAGVISNPDFEKAGQTAAQAWLILLDRKDWGTAWDASSAVFRQTVPLGNWMDAIPKVRQPFGALVERLPGDAVYKTSLPGRPDGQYVTVMFLSQYKNQNVQELITTVREGDGRWRVTGYSPKQVP